jgi:hypothetical protein
VGGLEAMSGDLEDTAAREPFKSQHFDRVSFGPEIAIIERGCEADQVIGRGHIDVCGATVTGKRGRTQHGPM